MKRRQAISLVLFPLFALALLLPTSPSAQQFNRRGVLITPNETAGGGEQRQHGRLWALLVGIDDYGSAVKRLEFAVKDVEAIRDRVLVKIPVIQTQVTLLQNADATKRRILSGLDSLVKDAGEDDTVMMYFAMHGKADRTGQNGYLLSSDADPNDLERTAVPVQTVLERLNETKARKVFVFLDACFSGTAVNSWAVGARTFTHGLSTRAVVSADILDRVKYQEGRFVISASKMNETSLELNNLGHGLFTYFVLQGLEGAAARPNRNYVTVHELFDYVKENVSTVARGLNQRQTPELKGVQHGESPYVTAGLTRQAALPSLDRVIRDAQREIESSRVVVSGNGTDTIKVYVGDRLKGSSSERRSEYKIGKEEFSGNEVAVRVVAVPSSGDRKEREETFRLSKGESMPVTVESTYAPVQVAPQRPKSRVIPPTF